MQSKITIAIDGYSSCGKSTLAKALAKRLKITYIDTGAMYRAITLFCLRNRFIENGSLNETCLATHINSINISFKYDNTTMQLETYLNNENVEREIRGMEVSNNVSLVSKVRFVRQKLVEMQRQMAGQESVVMDGRDIGTVVLPNADFKFFLTADVNVRAKRRYDELMEKGESISFEEIVRNVEYRDYQDETRTESPLRRADDAVIVDNTNMDREQQVDWILNYMESNNK